MTQLNNEQEKLINRIFELEKALRTIHFWTATTRTWRDEERLDILDKIEEKCEEALK